MDRGGRGIAPIRIPLGEGAVGRCVGEDKVLLVNDALDGDVSSPHWITGFATQQMLCVPLRVEGQVIGALEVLNKPAALPRETPSCWDCWRTSRPTQWRASDCDRKPPRRGRCSMS